MIIVIGLGILTLVFIILTIILKDDIFGCFGAIIGTLFIAALVVAFAFSVQNASEKAAVLQEREVIKYELEDELFINKSYINPAEDALEWNKKILTQQIGHKNPLISWFYYDYDDIELIDLSEYNKEGN